MGFPARSALSTSGSATIGVHSAESGKTSKVGVPYKLRECTARVEYRQHAALSATEVYQPSADYDVESMRCFQLS